MRRVTPDLGLRLLRKSVRHLAAGREDCASCRRTPLVGERVHVYANGSVVCELCRHQHAGEPEHSQLVRHSEFGHAVKPSVPIAA
jgi:hypothetical protein